MKYTAPCLQRIFAVFIGFSEILQNRSYCLVAWKGILFFTFGSRNLNLDVAITCMNCVNTSVFRDKTRPSDKYILAFSSKRRPQDCGVRECKDWLKRCREWQERPDVKKEWLDIVKWIGLRLEEKSLLFNRPFNSTTVSTDKSPCLHYSTS
jgi:hypothetical protein